MRRSTLVLISLLSSACLLSIGCGSGETAKPDASGSGGRAGSTGGGGRGGSSGGAGTTGVAGTTGGAGTTGAGGTTDAGTDASTDAPKDSTGDLPPSDANDATVDTAIDAGLTAAALRGQYLVNSVLGCPGCHTPRLNTGALDNTKFLSGVDCFTKDTGTNGCLASANLTNDDTGLKKLTDQQIKDAFTKGIDPDKVDGGTQYLFAQMPSYQFANLTDDDASAIVAYLRTVTGVAHTAPANGAPFDVRPTAAQWTPVSPAALPVATVADGGVDGGGTPSTSNGKYLATLTCVTCHTVNTAAQAPLTLDATKAFQGGKTFTTTVTVAADGGVDGGDGGADAGATTTISKTIQSANLTPDTTGLKDWTAAQIVAAIKTAKDETGRSLCSPMRSLPGLTDQDATDIANYLKAIPPVANALTMTCQ